MRIAVLIVSLVIVVGVAVAPTRADSDPQPTPTPAVGSVPAAPVAPGAPPAVPAAPLFHNFWATYGGVEVFGVPITAPQVITLNGQQVPVQWYERARFELRGPAVELGRLGVDLLQAYGIDWWTLPPGQPQPGCNYFEQTRHTLCGDFLTFWSSHPAPLLVYGLPISEPRWELHGGTQASVRLTQWFERARFELVDGTVNVAPIGTELLAVQPPAVPPAATATPTPQPETETTPTVVPDEEDLDDSTDT